MSYKLPYNNTSVININRKHVIKNVLLSYFNTY